MRRRRRVSCTSAWRCCWCSPPPPYRAVRRNRAAAPPARPAPPRAGPRNRPMRPARTARPARGPVQRVPRAGAVRVLQGRRRRAPGLAEPRGVGAMAEMEWGLRHCTATAVTRRVSPELQAARVRAAVPVAPARPALAAGRAGLQRAAALQGPVPPAGQGPVPRPGQGPFPRPGQGLVPRAGQGPVPRAGRQAQPARRLRVRVRAAPRAVGAMAQTEWVLRHCTAMRRVPDPMAARAAAALAAAQPAARMRALACRARARLAHRVQPVAVRTMPPPSAWWKRPEAACASKRK